MKPLFKPWGSFLFLLGLSAGCAPEPAAPTQPRISQPHVIELLQAANNREDSLVCAHTLHPDPFIRQLAAQHAASFTDTLLCDCLKPLLDDPVADVRQAAAYAIGQLPAQRCQAALNAHLEKETHPSVRYALYTAAGKQAKRFTYERIAELCDLPIEPCNDALLAFAFTARMHGLPDQNTLVARSLNALKCDDMEARNHAAWLLSVLPNGLSTAHQADLFAAWRQEQNLALAIPLTRALRNVNLSMYQHELDSVLGAPTPPSILIELLRLPQLFEVASVVPLTALLIHPAPGIPALAGKQLQQHSAFTQADLNQVPVAETSESRVAIAQLRCAVAPSDCTDLMALANSQNAWERAASLLALPSHLGERALIAALNDTVLVVKSTAAEVLIDRLSHEQIRLNYPDSIRTALLKTRDSGVIAVLATHLTAQPDAAKSALLTDLNSYAQNLELPRDAETYHLIAGVLEKANYAFERKAEGLPISLDFNYLAALGDTVVCEIITTAGTLRCELYPLHAPASVYSFLKLAEAGYYDNKFVHRVVPQFVIQSGCPRGDGWGGVDYVIRSEFALGTYREGSMGMASAGRDTESCQWFITHTATPHLNGRYSIFGQVVEGLETVHATNRGDVIERIRQVPRN